jgi:hypothetical protein
MKNEFSLGFMVSYVVVVLFWFIMLFIFCNTSRAENMAGMIDLEKISMIESSGNPMAHNKRDDSRGLYQITKIALQDFNNFHPRGQYTMDDLWNPAINERIARWMFETRIPQMLRHFKKPVTIENLIISFNAGIGYVAHDKPIPSITRLYLKKYGI